ncbi:hypothetical protein ACTEV4_000240 [Cronobacter turicensis]|uniref:hypothetical protein n=1 Tax=Cronobacter turicensis TaxID=413502 RepID=UPI0014124C15|nr:hypothetical protein [Cronobacter turicensis]NHV10166.1 hypothetical protein [Cronobacter turicensis]NHV63939.1 hypothetical protein [Cronobacter turicensis]NHW10711.1 hypothetical protein [Cronobacter turicensis]
MNPGEGHALTYGWSVLLGFFSVLSLQDYVFTLGAALSAFFTIKTYNARRRAQQARLAEERKRTALLRQYLKSAAQPLAVDRRAIASIFNEGAEHTEDRDENA